MQILLLDEVMFILHMLYIKYKIYFIIYYINEIKLFIIYIYIYVDIYFYTFCVNNNGNI